MRNRGHGRAALLAGFLLALNLLRPDSALAHALLQRADPLPGSLLQSSPTRVHLWFSEDLNGSASQIVVWDRYRHVESRGHARLVPGQSRQLETSLAPLTQGSYLVLWTSVSAADGHVLRGSYLFSVKERGPGPSLIGISNGGIQGFPDVEGFIGLIAHWIEMVALVTWVGSVAFSSFIVRLVMRKSDSAVMERESSRLRSLMSSSLAALFAASSVLLLLQARSISGDWSGALAGDTLRSLFAAEFGHIWIARQILALLALALMTAVVGRITPGRLGVPLVSTALGVVYLYLFAGSGHAASADIGSVLGSRLISASVFVDWLHLLAIALWLGGQVYIVAILAPVLVGRADFGSYLDTFLAALNRFSPVAYACVATFTVTGGFNGKVHIPSWYAFFHSAYGWALIVKLALIACMMLVSALTVYGLRPRLKRVMQGTYDNAASTGSAILSSLLRWLRAGPVLGAGVLFATSVMFSYPVPLGLSPPGPSSYTAEAGGLTAALSISPDRSGPNRVTVTLHDVRGRPVTQASIVVLTTMLDMPMGTGLGRLTPGAPGAFSGNVEVAMGGHWKLQILVYRPTGLTRMEIRVQVGL